MHEFGKNIEVDTCLADIVADLAKHECNRDALGVSGLIPACITLITQGLEINAWISVTQGCRALGNMCFEHDANRRRVLDARGVECLASICVTLQAIPEVPTSTDGNITATDVTDFATNVTNDVPKSATDATAAGVLGASVGVILNMAASEIEIQDLLIKAGVLDSLLWLCSSAETDRQQNVAWQALFAFNENKVAHTTIAASEVNVRLLFNFILKQQDNSDMRDEACLFLRAFVDTDANLSSLAAPDIVELIFRLSQSTTEKLAGTAAYVLSVALSDDICLKAFLTWARGGDEPEITSPLTLSTCVASLWRAGSVDVFISWIYKHRSSKNWDFPIAGAIAFGNIARFVVLVLLLLYYTILHFIY